MTFNFTHDIIRNMVKKISLNKKFYYVQCGDWDSVTVACSHKEACLNAMEKALDQFTKEEIEITEVMVSSNCDGILNDEENSTEAFLSEKIIKELSYEY